MCLALCLSCKNFLPIFQATQCKPALNGKLYNCVGFSCAVLKLKIPGEWIKGKYSFRNEADLCLTSGGGQNDLWSVNVSFCDFAVAKVPQHF